MRLFGRWRKFSSMVRQTVLPGQGEIGRTERFAATAVRFCWQMGRQFARDRCLRQASSLSYQTILVFVPLGAVLLALTQWVQRLGDRPAVTQLLEKLVMPQAARDLAERMAELVVRVDFETIGWVGGIFLTFLGGTLLLQIEDVLNDVWNVPRGRVLWQRALAMLGFVLFALPAFAAAFYLSIDRLRPPLDWLVPFGLLVLSLALIYKLLPHIRVRWRSAVAGALVAAVLLALGHWGYGAYVERFRWTYESVYGAIAFLPLTLLWVYASWLIFLLGAEVSYTSQNLGVLWARARRRQERSTLRDDTVGSVSWPNAIRAAREVAAAQRAGRGPVAPEFLALEIGIHVDSVNLIVSRLVLAGVLHRDPEGRLSLGRDPSSIALVEVYDAVVDRRPLDPDLEALSARHRSALRGLSLAAEASPR
ncbi:MAG: YihY family inner membrane protein [Deltaproteobacteria bacterium]|nr:YihY family inner membrane protein [Deltaproteobacteria bacterium]